MSAARQWAAGTGKPAARALAAGSALGRTDARTARDDAAGKEQAQELPRRDVARVRRPGTRANWRKALPYVLVVAFALWLYRVSDSFAASDVPGRIGPDAWPKIALGLMIFTGCLGIVKALFAGPAHESAQHAPASAGEDAPVLNPPELYPRMVWVAIAATVVYVFLWSLLGYFLATVVYSMALMWVGRQRRFGILAGAGVGFALFFMFLFMKIVYVSLPLGVEPFSQVSLALMSLMGIH